MNFEGHQRSDFRSSTGHLYHICTALPSQFNSGSADCCDLTDPCLHCNLTTVSTQFSESFKVLWWLIVTCTYISLKPYFKATATVIETSGTDSTPSGFLASPRPPKRAYNTSMRKGVCVVWLQQDINLVVTPCSCNIQFTSTSPSGSVLVNRI